MASQQTVTFKIDVPYKDQDGSDQVRTCVLNLTLSVDDLLACEGGPGQITINSGVMPVGGTDPGSKIMGDEREPSAMPLAA